MDTDHIRLIVEAKKKMQGALRDLEKASRIGGMTVTEDSVLNGCCNDLIEAISNLPLPLDEEEACRKTFRFEVGGIYEHWDAWMDKDVLIRCRSREGDHVVLEYVKKKGKEYVPTGTEIEGDVHVFRAGYYQDLVDSVYQGDFKRGKCTTVMSADANHPVKEVA